MVIEAKVARLEGGWLGHCRALAGFLTVLSVALGYWVHPGFFLFTVFVGLNQFQSAFTNTCPAMAIFRMMGLKSCVPQDAAKAA